MVKKLSFTDTCCSNCCHVFDSWLVKVFHYGAIENIRKHLKVICTSYCYCKHKISRKLNCGFNGLITMPGQSVLRQILTEIKCSLWFSLIADEASDLSHNEHVSVTIRWTDGNYDIHKDTLRLIQLPNTKAQTIFGVLKDVLIQCSLPISQCRGQAYNGALNMRVVHNGVQALIKGEQSKALYIHCLAHSLNLYVQDVTKQCTLIRNVMEFIHDLVQLIKFSSKRLFAYDSLRKDAAIRSGESTPALRTLCPTRWTVRHGAINSILLNYETLLKTLDSVAEGVMSMLLRLVVCT